MNKKQLHEGSFKENITNLRGIYATETERKSSRNPEVDLNNYLLDLVKFFKEFKSKDKLEKLITIDSNEYFNRLFKKNWTILEALYGDNTSSST